MKNIIFIAPPAAGKWTQSKLVSEEYNIPHISTGDLLREEVNSNSALGIYLKEEMDKGHLINDETITTLLKNRLSMEDCKNGYILDGTTKTDMLQDSIQMALMEIMWRAMSIFIHIIPGIIKLL